MCPHASLFDCCQVSGARVQCSAQQDCVLSCCRQKCVMLPSGSCCALGKLCYRLLSIFLDVTVFLLSCVIILKLKFVLYSACVVRRFLNTVGLAEWCVCAASWHVKHATTAVCCSCIVYREARCMVTSVVGCTFSMRYEFWVPQPITRSSVGLSVTLAASESQSDCIRHRLHLPECSCTTITSHCQQ